MEASDLAYAHYAPSNDEEEEREVDANTIRKLHACVTWGANREPVLYEEAIQGPQKEHWIKAMAQESKSLSDNGVYILCDLPKGRRSIGNKWVYKLKLEGDGS